MNGTGILVSRWNACREDAAAWAAGRHAPLRALLLLIVTWIFLRHLADPHYTSIIGGLNLGIHEIGHFLFAPFGEFAAVAGGSLLQCLVPVVAAGMFLRQRDWFAIAFAACWLGTNFFNVATYAADARTQDLPLVSPVDGAPIHDWFYLLDRTGMLQHDQLVALAFRFAGITAMLAGLAFGFWLIRLMVTTRTAQ
jgi:hypothetical protein